MTQKCVHFKEMSNYSIIQPVPTKREGLRILKLIMKK